VNAAAAQHMQRNYYVFWSNSRCWYNDASSFSRSYIYHGTFFFLKLYFTLLQHSLCF